MMALLQVDEEKCKRDRVCAAVCPMRIIEFKSKKAFPTMIAGGDELCIRCGHCVAVCPHSAISHEIMSTEECTPIRRELNLQPDQVEQLLKSRRSVRAYKKTPVDRDLLIRLIDLAAHAPSGHNTQPVHWRVIYDSDEVLRLAGIVAAWMRSLIAEGSPLAETLHLDRVVAAWDDGNDRICRSAPHVIVAHAHRDERTAPAGCTIALTYLELATLSLGLGACWAGYFNLAANSWPPMAKALDLPDGHISFGAMLVGHPKFKYQRIPLRKKPRVTWR
jgi:nitroreductase/NAD-dependent dihydropyrimidine dehydrogenase PreA subunit